MQSNVVQNKVSLHFEEYCNDRRHLGSAAGTMDSLKVHPLIDLEVLDGGGDGTDLYSQNFPYHHLLRVPPKKDPRPLNHLQI